MEAGQYSANNVTVVFCDEPTGATVGHLSPFVTRVLPGTTATSLTPAARHRACDCERTRRSVTQSDLFQTKLFFWGHNWRNTTHKQHPE